MGEHMDVSLSIYEHAAFLIGKTPWEASRDPDLIFEGHAEAYRRYKNCPVMPGIDIYNLEPEAYGAVVEEQSDVGPPAISVPILSDVAGLLDLPPLDPTRDGRIPMLIDVARRLKATFPDADIRVPLSGPFSIASNLLGFDTLLIGSLERPEDTRAALEHLVEGQVRFARAIKSAGVDVAFFESAACPPLLSPSLFQRVELPALTLAMRRIGDVVGHPIPCIIGGDTTPIVDMLIETGSGALVCPAGTDQAAFMARVRLRPEIRIRVNCDHRIIASGGFDEIAAEARRVIGLIGDHPNACIGSGALPYETPPENALYLVDFVARETS